MLEYRLPYNRDFSAGTNVRGRQLRPSEEVGYIDSPFAVIVPEDASVAQPRITDDEDFGISPFSLVMEQPEGAGVQTYVEWARPVEFFNEELWGQLYVKVTDLPADDWTLFRFVGQDDTVGTRMVIHPDGSAQMYVGDTASTSPTSSFLLEPGERYRIEWHIKFAATVGAAVIEANFYYNDYDDISEASKKIDHIGVSGTSTILESGNRLQIGWVTGAPGNGAQLYLGGLSMNEEGFPGPCLWYYNPDELGDQIYEQMEPLVETFGDPGGHLRIFCRASGRIHAPLYSIMRDGPNGEPGWSQVLDNKRLAPQWLPWSSQLIGYRAPVYRISDDASAYLGRQTLRMKKYSSHVRGGTDALRDIVKDNLWGKRRVIILERAGNQANQIRVYVYQDDIMAGMTTDDLEGIARAQKATGLIMEFVALTGDNNYQLLQAHNANYAVLKAKHPNYQSAHTDPGLD